MREFRYEKATDAAGAVAVLSASPEGAYLGGGTNLVDLMRLGVATPDVLVDVRQLTSTAVDELPDGGLRIGAAAPTAELAGEPRVVERFPLLAQALHAGASGQLRHRATVGGNLLQRTRCTSFTDLAVPCNKRAPGTGCGAVGGDHRALAVLGATNQGAASAHTCVATHASDMAVALRALDASVRVLGADGERSIPIGELHRLPGTDPARDTTLRHGELVTAVEVPALAWATRSRYRKLRDRAAEDFALVSVAAAMDLRGSGPDAVVADVRIALGGVAHVPWRAGVAEGELRGGPATGEAFAAAAAAELAAAQPLPENAYKLPLVSDLLTRTLRQLSAG